MESEISGKNCLAETRQTVDMFALKESVIWWESYGTVFDPVGLVASRIEGVAILPTLVALPHSPLGSYKYRSRSRARIVT